MQKVSIQVSQNTECTPMVMLRFLEILTVIALPPRHPVKEVVLLHLRHNHKNFKGSVGDSSNPNQIVISAVDPSGKKSKDFLLQ